MNITKTPNWEEATNWQTQWEEQQNKISDLRDKIWGNPRNKTGARVPQAEEIDNLLTCLERFASQQIGYLVQAVTGSEFEPTPEVDAQRVGQDTFDQIEADIGVVDLIIDARLNPEHKPYWEKHIKLADHLAQEALAPAAELLQSNLPQVFTYFTESKQPKAKVINIRLIPYANVALIGIPKPSGEHDYLNLLAIPHEVGHYIFWHGKGVRDYSFLDITEAKVIKLDSFDDLKELAIYSTLFNYQEEIFADVYSALIAGPLVAKSSQYFQRKTVTSDSFTKDDSEHPIPVIRPFIFIYVLQKLFYIKGTKTRQFQEWATGLHSEWNNALEVEGFTNKKLNLKPKGSWNLLKTFKDKGNLCPLSKLIDALSLKTAVIEGEVNPSKAANAAETAVGEFKATIEANSAIATDVAVKATTVAEAAQDPANKLDVDAHTLKLMIKEIVNNIVDLLSDSLILSSENNFWTQYFENKEAGAADWQAEFTEKVEKEIKEVPFEVPYGEITAKWEQDWKSWTDSDKPEWWVRYKADGWTFKGDSNPWKIK